MFSKTNEAVRQAARQSKYIAVAAVGLGAWVALCGAVISGLNGQTSLSGSIEKVLSYEKPSEPATGLVVARLDSAQR